MFGESPARALTIGHSNHRIEILLGLLKDHQVGIVVDTRSQPYSKYSPQFDRETLKPLQPPMTSVISTWGKNWAEGPLGPNSTIAKDMCSMIVWPVLGLFRKASRAWRRVSVNAAWPSCAAKRILPAATAGC